MNAYRGLARKQILSRRNEFKAFALAYEKGAKVINEFVLVDNATPPLVHYE